MYSLSYRYYLDKGVINPMRFLLYLCFLPLVFAVRANEGLQYYQANNAPHRVHVVVVDLTAYDMKLAPAWGTMLGLSAVPEIAQRTGAVAAINSSFYHKNPAYAGTSASARKIDGVWQNASPKIRGAMG